MKTTILFKALLMNILLFGYSNMALCQITKYRIHTKRTIKGDFESGKTMSKSEEDVVMVNVYYDRTVIKPQNQGWSITLMNKCVYHTDKWNENGATMIQEAFLDNNKPEIGLSYIRNIKASRECAVLQIYRAEQGKGVYYSFAAYFGEIWDNKQNKWVSGKSVLFDYSEDQIRQRLRKDIGRFCPNFDYELSERVDLGGDPWKQ